MTRQEPHKLTFPPLTLISLRTQENRCLRTIHDAHSHFATCLALSAKHATLVSASVDKNVCVWGLA